MENRQTNHGDFAQLISLGQRGIHSNWRLRCSLTEGATAVVEPEFTGGMAWYMGYGERHASDGAEGRLVNYITFTESWTEWEMHPKGDEVALCTVGLITLHQEKADGTKATVTLGPGEYIVNEPGTWHTADVEESATALFITAGEGTEGRPR